MISADANTGVERMTKNAVINVVQANMGIRNIVIPGARILNIVTMKLIAPIVEDAPKRITATSQKSIPTPAG